MSNELTLLSRLTDIASFPLTWKSVMRSGQPYLLEWMFLYFLRVFNLPLKYSKTKSLNSYLWLTAKIKSRCPFIKSCTLWR